MQNRSISNLPSIYAPSLLTALNEEIRPPYSLEVFDITFLHFHSCMR